MSSRALTPCLQPLGVVRVEIPASDNVVYRTGHRRWRRRLWNPCDRSEHRRARDRRDGAYGRRWGLWRQWRADRGPGGQTLSRAGLGGCVVGIHSSVIANTVRLLEGRNGGRDSILLHPSVPRWMRLVNSPPLQAYDLSTIMSSVV